MKEEKYVKALEIHEEKLFGYSRRLKNLVAEMLDDHVSVVEVYGLFESVKFDLERSVDTTAGLMAGLYDEVMEED